MSAFTIELIVDLSASNTAVAQLQHPVTCQALTLLSWSLSGVPVVAGVPVDAVYLLRFEDTNLVPNVQSTNLLTHGKIVLFMTGPVSQSLQPVVLFDDRKRNIRNMTLALTRLNGTPAPNTGILHITMSARS